MKWFHVVLLTVALCLALFEPMRAQREDDILRPVPFRFHVGPLIGMGYNASYGEFKTQCDCLYSGGYGFGPVIGGFVDYPVSRDMSVYVIVSSQSLNASYDKAQQRIEYVEQLGAFRPVDFELETDLTLYTLGVGTFLKWETPVPGLYLAGGPELSFVAYSNIEETERIVTPGFTYATSGARESTFLDGALGDYYDAPSFRLAIAGKIGYIIPLLDRLSLAPELTIAFPLTSVASEYSTWRILPYQLTVAARFGI